MKSEPVAVQLSLIAPVQQLAVADDHANRLPQIVRHGISELPELFVMALLFGKQTSFKLVERRRCPWEGSLWGLIIPCHLSFYASPCAVRNPAGPLLS